MLLERPLKRWELALSKLVGEGELVVKVVPNTVVAVVQVVLDMVAVLVQVVLDMRRVVVEVVVQAFGRHQIVTLFSA